MKQVKAIDDIYEDDFHYDKRHTKESRSKEKSDARRKVDAYLEKKSLKELLSDYVEDDYDFDWDNYGPN